MSAITAITSVFVVGVFAALILSAPSPDDVKRCAATTNYTLKRCEFELSR